MLESADFAESLALLEWQVELGATEAIGEEPVNRYEEVNKATLTPPPPEPTREIVARLDKAEAEWLDNQAVKTAERMAESAGSLDALREAIGAYEFCELKKGARNVVFSDGFPSARLMIVGEAPGRDEEWHS